MGSKQKNNSCLGFDALMDPKRIALTNPRAAYRTNPLIILLKLIFNI